MPKKVKKIWVGLHVDLDDLAIGVSQDNTYEEVISFIREIDVQQQDWAFTRKLRALVEELMEEEDGTRVGSKDDAYEGRPS